MGIFDIFKGNKNKTISSSSGNSSFILSSNQLHEKKYVRDSATTLPFSDKDKELFAERVGITFDNFRKIMMATDRVPELIGYVFANDKDGKQYEIFVYRDFIFARPCECEFIHKYDFLSKNHICINPNARFLNKYVHGLGAFKESHVENMNGRPVCLVSFNEDINLPTFYVENIGSWDVCAKHIKQNKNKNNSDSFFFGLYNVKEKEMKSLVLGDMCKESFDGIRKDNNQNVRIYCLGKDIFAIAQQNLNYDDIKGLFKTRPYDKKAISESLYYVKKSNITFEGNNALIRSKDGIVYMFDAGSSSFLRRYLTKEKKDSDLIRYNYSIESLIAKMKTKENFGIAKCGSDTYLVTILDTRTFAVSKCNKDSNELDDLIRANKLSEENIGDYLYILDDVVEVYSDEAATAYYYKKSPNAFNAALGGAIFGSMYAVGELIDSQESHGAYISGSLHVILKNSKTGKTTSLSIYNSSERIYYYFFSFII